MESLNIFHNFKLDNLNKDWIKSIWEADFTIYEELPDEDTEYLESDEVRLLLHKSGLVLKAWIAANCQCESTEFSWENLMILNINMRGLLAMLAYIIRNGQRSDTDEASRQACLEATSLYLMLLAVPGSNVFHVYHPNLYQKAIETLRISESLFSHRRKSSKEIDAISVVDNSLSDHYVLSHSVKRKFVKGLSSIIVDLITMVKLFRFKEYPESLDITIQTLLNVTRLEMYIKYGDDNMDYEVTLLSQNAFAALQELCSNNHGSISLTITMIAQYMLPYLLFHQTNIQLKFITVTNDTAIFFLENLLKIHEKETALGIITLIHQLMVKCPEKMEGRQRQATTVIKLLNICKKDIIAKVFRDIILFSYSGKIFYRLFAQEIVGRLLLEFFLLNNDLDEDTRVKMKKILIAVVLSRCMDRSPLVRGKAIATLATFSDCNNNTDKTILTNIFETSTTDKAFSMPDDLREALSNNIDPLPGSNTLIAMLLDRVNDERALVRRSALKILRNLSIMFPSLVSKTTQVISDRCRDPTLTVRQFAVHVLSDILEQFPKNSELLDEWVRAVMPQIYDIETKVQEKVLECLESVLIGRITKSSDYIPNAANSLPWRILNKLCNLRMRKHLSKVCSLWVKNGVINKSVISNLQSHVGTSNTIGAWILLASLAENTKIPDINKYITDYKEIILKNDFHASLILHVIRHTWSTLDRECLEDLYQHLYKCIYQFEINFNLISICLDILCSISRYLHADESGNLVESNMVELMKLSEAKLSDILEEIEDRTQDTFKIRVIFTLGHASLMCNNKISSSTLQILESLLSQWESLPSPVREIKDLQASAVVFLCQQALRDREIAQEVTPIFGNLMRHEANTDSLIKTAVKINAAKALADICIRFTALVEPYLPDMCMSMKDSNPIVREAILVIFIQLLLEDFIKVKGPFFFHILTMLLDTNNMIRELTVFLVEERLLIKNKALISQQFLESIFHYNNYRSRDLFCGHRMSDKEKELLTLPGKANQDKRNVIYEFMLERLDPLGKFKLVAKLTKHILREICYGNSINIALEEGTCVFKDTLFILNNNRLQVSSLVDKHKDDVTELDETTNTASTPSSNAMNIIVVGMKKHNLDNLLPMLIVLKKKLTTLKSSIMDDVEKLLFKIYSDYDKEHLFSLLNEYPELEKDMERYQRKLKDKTTSESDSTIGSNSLPIVVNTKNTLRELCMQTIPRVLLRRLSPTTISRHKNVSSDHHLQMATPDVVKKLSVELKKLEESSSLESNFSTSTPISFLNLDSDSPRVSRIYKRSSSEEDNIMPHNRRRKVLRKSLVI